MAEKKVLTKAQIVKILLKKEAYKGSKSSVLMKELKSDLVKRLDEFHSIEPVKDEAQKVSFLAPTEILKQGVSFPLDEMLKVVFKGRKASLLLHLE